MIFLLDANTLIEAKNRYYQMSICPGYWAWLKLGHGKGTLTSVESVGEELRRGNDELAQWARDHAALFQPESDIQTQTAFMAIAQYLAAQASLMKAGALEEFLGGADPWLIAKALATGASVVTHERLNMQNRKKFLIPNVCLHFDVPCLDTFELLNRLEARFILAS
jgi:hypothetical protein